MSLSAVMKRFMLWVGDKIVDGLDVWRSGPGSKVNMALRRLVAKLAVSNLPPSSVWYFSDIVHAEKFRKKNYTRGHLSEGIEREGWEAKLLRCDWP